MKQVSLKWKLSGCFVLVALLLVLSVPPGMAQDAGTAENDSSAIVPQFGGPNSVSDQLADDQRIKETLTGLSTLKRYFSWKDRLREKYFLSFSLDYTAGALTASNTISTEDFFASGALRFYGTWTPVGHESGNTGAFVWKIENRHSYTTISVQGAASQIGYVGLILPILSDIGTRLTNLYWKQNLKHGRVEIIGGFIDTTDWVDVFALASPWNGVFNFALATGSATIPVPDDATIGAYVNAMLTEHLYIIAGISDANSNSTDPFNGFNTFFDDNEYFTSVELGWTTSQDRFYFDNMHLTLWHVDARTQAMTPSGWGVAFSYAHARALKWTPFFRGGYSKDGGSLLQKSITVGVGYHLDDDKSLFILGFNWNQPNEGTFGGGLRDQFSTEVSVRLQVAQNFQLAPMISWIIDPARNPTADESWLFALRGRLAF